MKGYVEQALTELEHILTNKRHQSAPSRITRPDYGATIQYVQDDNGEPVNEQRIRKIQHAVGKFLYYARAIDVTMQHAVNDIGTKAKNATTSNKSAVQYFLDYAYHNRDAEIIFRASDMILQSDSDAAYLVMPEARSRAGGYHFLGSKDHTLFNGAIYVLARVIKNVMASAMEAEVSALYENAQKIMEF